MLQFFSSLGGFRKLEFACLSHKATIRLIDLLGKDYDEPVKAWSKEISQMIWTVHMQ